MRDETTMKHDDEHNARLLQAVEDVLDMVEDTLPTAEIATTVLALAVGRLCAAHKLAIANYLLIAQSSYSADSDTKFANEGFLQLSRGRPWEN